MSELAYAQITSNASVTGSVADVSGLTVTFTAPSAPVVIRVYVPSFFSATQFTALALSVTDAANTGYGSGGGNCSSVAVLGNYFGAGAMAMCRLSLTAGVDYTFKVRANATANTTISVSSASPAFIQAESL